MAELPTGGGGELKSLEILGFGLDRGVKAWASKPLPIFKVHFQFQNQLMPIRCEPYLHFTIISFLSKRIWLLCCRHSAALRCRVWIFKIVFAVVFSKLSLQRYELKFQWKRSSYLDAQSSLTFVATYTLLCKLKGHWTTSTSSPNFFQKTLRFLHSTKWCIPM